MRPVHKMLLSCVLLAASPDILANIPQPGGEMLATMRLEGEIEIDTEGRVANHTIHTRLDDDTIAGFVDKAIAAWTFTPILHEGKPAIGRASMRITLGARKLEGGDHEVFFDDVYFGGEAANQASFEITKMRLWRHDIPVVATVTIGLRLAPDGTLLEAAPIRCAVRAAGGRDVQYRKACRALEWTSLRGIEGFEFRRRAGVEAVDVAPDYTAKIAFDYIWNRKAENPKAGKWRSEWRMTDRKLPWSKGKRDFAGLSGLGGDGQLVDGTGSLELRTGGSEALLAPGIPEPATSS